MTDRTEANKVTALELASCAADIKSLAESLVNAALTQQWEWADELLADIATKTSRAVTAAAGRQ